MREPKYLIGLSGGINSMAVLCWLIEQPDKPNEIHLYYAHFKEHSPDTFKFVADGIRYARKHFLKVHVTITRNSIIEYFENEKMIPHPAVSPCSLNLKIKPMETYSFENSITVDLIGYVKHELKKRAGRQTEARQMDLFSAAKQYPIGQFTDDWCFEIVEKHIGWYPYIYTIKDEKGKRIFKHNNCLPCKNMYPEDIEHVKNYFPWYYQQAIQLSARLGKYWGRNADQFYTQFGRDLGQDTTCSACKF